MLARKTEREAKADQIGAFMFELAERDEPLTEFDDRLWLAVIDTVQPKKADYRSRFPYCPCNISDGAGISANHG